MVNYIGLWNSLSLWLLLWFVEVVLIILNSYHIYLVCCTPRFPLVGETPSNFSNLYICAHGFHSKLYAHVKGEFSLFIELRWIYSYHILKISRKMSKFFQSSIPSLPYVLCIKLTWNFLSLQNLCCHQLPKRGRLKASRPLIHILVINDNICGLTIFLREFAYEVGPQERVHELMP